MGAQDAGPARGWKGRALKNSRLLVLDDESMVCDFIDQVATGDGFDVVTTLEPNEFASSYRSHEPDVIILDLKISGHDGIEQLRFLATNECQASILLISGMDGRVLNTARRLGATQGLRMTKTLPKPFGPNELRSALDDARGLTLSGSGRNGSSRNSLAKMKVYGTPRNSSPPSQPVSEDELRRAIEQQELVLHYQPKVDLRCGRVLGAEALVRWRHHRRGLIMPDAFIPLAEETGLIKSLTRFVTKRALEQCAAWTAEGMQLSVAVNISAPNLSDLTFADEMAELVSGCGLAGHQLILEVTESEAMSDPVRTMDVLSRLRLNGIELAIDDFGTGFSSLAELRNMPFSEIKIDKSFVIDSIVDKEARVFVRSIIELGRDLGLTVVAEGVENEEIWRLLVSLGCDVAQGYYIARPMDAEEWTNWIKDWKSRNLVSSTG